LKWRDKLKDQHSKPSEVTGVLDRLNTSQQQPCRANDSKDHQRKNDAAYEVPATTWQSCGFALKNGSDHEVEFNKFLNFWPFGFRIFKENTKLPTKS
jgi:hypothetical protein